MKKAAIFLVAFFLIFNSLYSQVNIQEKNTLKILSWNIYMLPRFVKNTGKVERAKYIAEKIIDAQYDIVVFQEAFHGKARKEISKQLQKEFPFVAGPANNGPSLKANSGIWIFSKYPIVKYKSISFKSKYGVDALSRKGGLLVELSVNGQHIQVIGTHLQNSGNENIKYNQCQELLTKLILPNQKNNTPQIICGDFNINKESNSYYKMIDILGVMDGILTGDQKYTFDRINNDLHDEEGVGQELIDYIFLRNTEEILSCVKRQILLLKEQWHKNHTDLSDHYPVEAEVVVMQKQGLSGLLK